MSERSKKIFGVRVACDRFHYRYVVVEKRSQATALQRLLNTALKEIVKLNLGLTKMSLHGYIAIRYIQ